MKEMVYLNGAIMPRRRATISVDDYGFLYGYGLFETMRAYRGRVFRLERHLERLAQSAELLGIAIDKPELENAASNVLMVNRLSDARIRITVSIGEGGPIPDPAACGRPTVLVTAVQYIPHPEEVYRRGFQTVTSSLRRNSQSPLSRLKPTSYLESLLARQEALRAGADEALCLNERGLLAEASTSNVFLVSGGSLRTPGPDSGLLPGITRGTVLELARKLGIRVVEGDIKIEELRRAGEAFLTGSLIEVMPLVVVDGRPVADGKPGPVTGRLGSEYRQLVESEI